MKQKKGSSSSRIPVKIFKSMWGMNARQPDKPAPAVYHPWRVDGSFANGATLEDPFGRMDDVATLEKQFGMIRDAGYDGVESGVPQASPAVWRRLCAKFDLEYICLIFADDPAGFRKELNRAKAYEPILIISHSGQDKMTFEEGSAFFEEVLEIQSREKTPVAHETHRLRLFYSPFPTAAYLR